MATLIGVVAAGHCQAAARVELLLVTERGASLTAQQTWMRELAQAGVQNIRIRQARSGERPGIEVRGSQDRPSYLVTGTLGEQDEVVLPGGRFRQGEAARLARWLNDLALHGPPRPSEPAGAFGLTKQQNEETRKSLSARVAGSTKGRSPAEIVQRIRQESNLPIEVDVQTLGSLGSEPLGEELAGLSCGTALAYALRGAGYCLVPRRSAGGAIEYAVVPAGRAAEIWPVGWPPEVPRLKLLPEFVKEGPIHIENVSVAQVLEAVAGRLEIPLLVDHNALARHGIDPAKTLVSIPQSQTNYEKVLGKALFQARLKSEIRVDESGKPFLWVTTAMPLGTVSGAARESVE